MRHNSLYAESYTLVCVPPHRNRYIHRQTLGNGGTENMTCSLDDKQFHHLIAHFERTVPYLLEEELGEVGPILAGDAGDDGLLDGRPLVHLGLLGLGFGHSYLYLAFFPVVGDEKKGDAKKCRKCVNGGHTSTTYILDWWAKVAYCCVRPATR